jgi:hypothetical protein
MTPKTDLDEFAGIKDEIKRIENNQLKSCIAMNNRTQNESLHARDRSQGKS